MKITEYRKELNLSQSELAEMVGVGQSTIAMWESGERMPRVKFLKKLSEIFGCSIDHLLY